MCLTAGTCQVRAGSNKYFDTALGFRCYLPAPSKNVKQKQIKYYALACMFKKQSIYSIN